MSVKVVDLNTETVKEEAPAIEPIEEKAKEEAPEPEPTNEVVEEPNELPKEEEPKKEKPKRQTQKDRIQCPKCLKEVSLKTYRYSHEKNVAVNYQISQLNLIPIQDQNNNQNPNLNNPLNRPLMFIILKAMMMKTPPNNQC